jgi:hypothetical protein
MEMKTTCAHCGVNGSYGQTFSVHGKYNGYPAFRCEKCGNGSYVTNAGRALVTKRAYSRPITSEAWTEMNRLFKNNTTVSEISSSENEEEEIDGFHETPGEEFVDLIRAYKDLRFHLREIVEISRPLRAFNGTLLESEDKHVMIELWRLTLLVSDRDPKTDDVLASLILFLISANLDGSFETLRKGLEEVSFPGSSSLLNERMPDFLADSEIGLLLKPSEFMGFYCAVQDQDLIVNQIGPKLTELYLAAVVQFGVEVSKSSILIGDKSKSIARLGTSCSSQLQFMAHLEAHPKEPVSSTLSSFRFSPEKADLGSDFRTAIQLLPRLTTRYFDGMKEIFSDLADVKNSIAENSQEHVLGESPEGTKERPTGVDAVKSRIESLQSLLNQGVITQGEFDEQRLRIIIEV